jgi:8-oxo-dGTP pyrophosphatase MutT (NUDIX family)
MSALFDEVSRLFQIGHEGPPPELFSDQRLEGVTEFRPAAVLAAFTDRPGNPGILLIHRPSSMRSHPGQIAFPGGGIDPGETPVEAALRETWEELGIHQRDVRVIGTSDIYRTHSGFEITPVLGVVPADVEINPNPTEVAQWFEAPASFLLDPANQKQQWVEWEGSQRAYYEIAWHDHQIWGITAAILVNLSRRLRWHG